MGVHPGDSLIVHSSMKSLGPVEGGPQTLIHALCDVVTEAGTVMLPTFTKPDVDRIYDPRTTPCRLGLVPETFRQMPGVLRSLHPTHSVGVWGRHAIEWTQGHEKVGGLAKTSPMHRAAQAGAKVIMVGCTMASCSIVHVAESIAGARYVGRVFYPGYEEPMTIVAPDGQRIVYEARDVPTCSIKFVAVGNEMDTRHQIQRPKLGEATCLLFRAQDAIDAALHMLERDPAALLCDHPKCAVCPKARAIVTAAA